MRTIALLALALTLTACGSDSVGPAAAPVAFTGAYNLTTVDGRTLPVTMIDLGAYRAKLASGSLNLKPDGTYSFDFGIRIEDSGNVRTTSDSDGGTWTKTDNTVTLTSTEGSATRSGTLSGSVMTLQSSEVVFGLTKQQP